jgi:amino acid permease
MSDTSIAVKPVNNILAMVGVAHGSSTVGTVGMILACIVGIGMVTLPSVFARAGWVGGILIMVLLPIFLTYMAINFFRVIEKVVGPDGRPPASFPDVVQAAFGVKGRYLTALTLYSDYTLFLSLLMLTLSQELQKYIVLTDTKSLVIVAVLLSPCGFVRSSSIASKMSIIGMIGVVMLCGLLLVTGIEQARQDIPGRQHDWFRFDAFQLGVSVANVMLVFAASGIIPTIVQDMQTPTNFPKVAVYVFALGAAIYITVGVLAYAAWGNVFIAGATSVLTKISEVDEARKVLLTVSLVLVCLPQFAITAMVVNQGVDILVGPSATYKQFFGRILLHMLQAAIVLAFDSIESLLAVISSFTNVILVVLLPAMLSWKLRGTKYFSIASCLFGLTVMAFGSTFAIDSYIKQQR